MSRIKEPFDLYSIADVVEKNYEFCHSATRVFVYLLSFFLSFFFFFSLFWTRATDWTEKERQLVLWRTAYVEDLMGLLPFVFWCFFPFLDFSYSFPRMTRYSKRNRGKQLATRKCSNIFSQRVSHRLFSQSIDFWRLFFPYVVVVIILWSLCRHRQHILIEYLMNSVSF